MATPHISADPGDFAESVLLPGDPLRAEHIAENFLTDATMVTSVRNMLGFTGNYKGVRVSVMGTGMGIPSASIYATELVQEYGVKNLIRIGSCGALSHDVALRDIIVAMGACTDNNVNRTAFRRLRLCSHSQLRTAAGLCRRCRVSLEHPVHVGNIYTTDLFYHPDEAARLEYTQRMGVLAVEMETAGLYGLAAQYGARAVALMTVSDHVLTHESTSAEERQTTFNEMVQIALDTAVAISR